MEPDDYVVVPTMNGKSYVIPTGHSAATSTWQITKKEPVTAVTDLAKVSTRDLMNEIYRRRAIEKFDYSVEIPDIAYTQNTADQRKLYAVKELLSSLTAQKFVTEKALAYRSWRDNTRDTTIYSYEIYLCKHPIHVKTDLSFE